MRDDIFKHAGVLLTTDNLDIEHIRFSPDNRVRARRFDALRQELLALKPGTAGSLAAALVASELIPAHELQAALDGSSARWNGITYLDWIASDRLCRRALTPLTLAYVEGTGTEPKEELCSFARWASKVVYTGTPEACILADVAIDQVAWAARNLAPVVWAHVTGLRPMATVPATYLQRASTALIPPLDLDNAEIALEADHEIFVDSFDDVQGDDRNDEVVQQALAGLSVDSAKTDKENLSDWLAKVLSLQELATNMGPITYLILCWVADIVESGTAKKVDADIKTRQRYCKVLAPALFRSLKSIGKPLSAWNAGDLQAGYTAIVSTVPDKRAASAALLSFAQFVHEVFDMPLVYINTLRFIGAPAVRAQLISHAEIRRAIAWVNLDDGDVALHLMLRAALAMAYAAPFRLRELLFVRKANIARLGDSSFEVEIVPLVGKNKLKTLAAKRRVLIQDAMAVEALQQLFDFREAQGWSSVDLLFGSHGGGAGEIYRRHALYRSLLTLLKASTGDRAMTFHALRHTYASRRFQSIIEQPDRITPNALVQLAEEMGHVSASTTLTYYVHIYEHALRAHLQHANAITLSFDSNTAGRLLGKSSAAVRKQAQRKAMATNAVVFEELALAAAASKHPTAPTPEGWMTPSRPVLPNGFSDSLDPFKTLVVLQSLAVMNSDPNLVASQLRLEPKVILAIEQVVVGLAVQVVRPQNGQRKPVHPTNVRTALNALFINIDAANNPKYQHAVDVLAKLQTTSVLQLAVRYWVGARRPNYIGLHEPQERASFLRLLKQLGFNREQLLINTHTAQDPLVLAADRATLTRQFQAEFGLSPHFAPPRAPHPARPKSYLLVAGPKSGSAGNSAAGLEALLLALYVFMHVSEAKDA